MNVFDTPLSRYPVDLHTHTTRSDGFSTPAELINRAAALGLYALGITDHDVDPPICITLDGGLPQDLVAYARRRGVLLVLGCEFSTDTWVDDVHICGYNLDWNHPDFRAFLQAAARSKPEAYHELCKRLTALGLTLDWEDDILHSVDPQGNPVIRRPDQVQRKHIFEAMAAKGYAANWSEAKLFVRDNPNLNVRRHKIHPIDAIDLIHRCGGKAVLAHPYLINDWVTRPGETPISRFEYIEWLLIGGLDGIEVRYTYDKTTYTGQQTPEQIEAEIRARYSARLPILSGGSDYHGAQNQNPQRLRSLGERGLTIQEFEAIQGFLNCPTL